MEKLITISAVCEALNLVDKKSNKPLNHIIRYWEKEFYQIKPKKINNRRYYKQKDIELLKIIKSLAKDHKISIKGIKNILRTKIKGLDANDVHSLRNIYQKEILKTKTNKLLNKINKIKNYGKKVSS